MQSTKLYVMKTFWDRFAAIGGGIFGSVKSIHGFFFLNIPELGISSIMPDLIKAFIFGFIGGLAGWAAKKLGDALVYYVKSKFKRNEKH